MTAVDSALTEINERLATFAPQHEGLRDFQSLNLKDTTRVEIEASLALYDRRKDVLEKAKLALEQLNADGHPELAVREISADAFADLQDNTRTIEAAMARFASNAATSLVLNEGTIAPK
jgi:oligoribonuclease NrnB/cAMP/cGMP phosphodiesterase (DHH superfamily)